MSVSATREYLPHGLTRERSPEDELPVSSCGAAAALARAGMIADDDEDPGSHKTL